MSEILLGGPWKALAITLAIQTQLDSPEKSIPGRISILHLFAFVPICRWGKVIHRHTIRWID